MDLKTYFENTKGSGIVATADKDGIGYALYHGLI
jgi:hypothetical protein